MKGEVNELSPAFTVCRPSNRKRDDPGPAMAPSAVRRIARDGRGQTVIRFDGGNSNPSCVGDSSGDVIWERLHPFRIHIQHVNN